MALSGHDVPLLVGGDWSPNVAGGLNRYLHGLVHAVARSGIRGHGVVTFLRDGQSGPIGLRAMAQEGASLRARWRGARLAAREAFRDGVTVANPHFALYALPWLRLLPTGVPMVANFHGPWADELAAERSGLQGAISSAMARVIERRVYARADRLIVLSKAFAALLCDRYGVVAQRVAVVPGGFDPAPYVAAPARTDARARLGWPADRPIILTVRRLARRMGIDVLIEAAGQLRQRHPDVLIMVAGRGAIAHELQARVAQLDLVGNVHLLGFVPDDDLPSSYAAADLTVLPTVALEGFGLSAVESLAAGTPVIGTPVGGIPEVLSGLSPGLVTAGCTPTDLAQKLGDALAGRLALPSPDDCRRHALRFGWEAVWPQVRRVWGEAASACAGREPA